MENKIRLPQPFWRNVKECYRSVSSSNVFDFAVFRHVEPTFYESGNILWSIEYTCITNKNNLDLVLFLEGFHKKFEEIFLCTVKCVSYNLKNRLIVKVESSIEGESPKNKILSQVVEQDEHLVSASEDTLEEEMRIKSLPKQYHQLSVNSEMEKKKEKRNSNDAKQPDAAKHYQDITKIDYNSNVTSTTVPTNECSCEAEKSMFEIIDSHVHNSDAQILPNLISSVAETAEKFNSFVFAKFDDKSIYGAARLYLAYLSHKDDDVNYEGHTRKTVGLRLLCEGLPLGKTLIQFWYEYGMVKGLSEFDIEIDLISFYRFCETKYMLRRQHAKLTELLDVTSEIRLHKQCSDLNRAKLFNSKTSTEEDSSASSSPLRTATVHKANFWL